MSRTPRAVRRRGGFVVLCLVLAIASACVPPWADDDEASEGPGGLDRDLAEPAQVVPDGAAADVASAAETTLPGAAAGASGGGSPGASGSPGQPAGVRRGLAAATDRTGDAGLVAPGWADLVGVELIDDGAGTLEVRVRVAGPIPRQVEAGVVAGVGVDLFTAGQRESDHQVFLQATSEGWFAYLTTGGTFVDYPGSVTIQAAQFVATVPWSAIGGPSAGDLSAFVDWSAKNAVGVVVASEDHLPDDGRAPFA